MSYAVWLGIRVFLGLFCLASGFVHYPSDKTWALVSFIVAIDVLGQAFIARPRTAKITFSEKSVKADASEINFGKDPIIIFGKKIWSFKEFRGPAGVQIGPGTLIEMKIRPGEDPSMMIWEKKGHIYSLIWG
jgi:hypothetical protein